MKAGVRTLGIAESYRERRSTLAGAVVRANRVVDGFAFATCTVGGTDSTTAITSLFEDLGREDVRYLLVAGIAPAWFNVVDLHRLHEATGTPVLSVTFEGSEGLERAIREAFDGETVYVRSVGLADDEANDVVRTFTHEGGRPEPVRVARLAARGVDSFRRETQ